MGSFSALHWIVVGLVALVLFGRGRISEATGDFGKGISSFRKRMAEPEDAETGHISTPPAVLEAQPGSGNGNRDN